MKKNGCEIVFSCNISPRTEDQFKLCHHWKKEDPFYGVDCQHRVGDCCKDQIAQSEAMNPVTQWTSKPATEEGLYLIRKNGKISLMQIELPYTYMEFADGTERSVKPIEEE